MPYIRLVPLIGLLLVLLAACGGASAVLFTSFVSHAIQGHRILWFWLVTRKYRESTATMCPICSGDDVGEQYTSADTQAITAATNAYMQQQANITPIKVDIEKVSGDFARTRATPPESLMTDPATVFLKRTNGQWQGIIYGTAFDEETYNQLQIPRDLWMEQ